MYTYWFIDDWHWFRLNTILKQEMCFLWFASVFSIRQFRLDWHGLLLGRRRSSSRSCCHMMTKWPNHTSSYCSTYHSGVSFLTMTSYQEYCIRYLLTSFVQFEIIWKVTNVTNNLLMRNPTMKPSCYKIIFNKMLSVDLLSSILSVVFGDCKHGHYIFEMAMSSI